MSTTNATAKRRYGTGAIIEKNAVYYGKWRAGGKQIKRKLGPVRAPGTRDGLTRTMAEAKLRQLMQEVAYVAPEHRVTFAEIGETYLRHVEFVMKRKRSTGTHRERVGRFLCPASTGHARTAPHKDVPAAPAFRR